VLKAAFKGLRAPAFIPVLLGRARRRSAVEALADGRSGGFAPEATVAARFCASGG
jgi:hypothetical protein